ncbi:hypothetical protein HPB50_026587 [Hyalomma asiaticum]|uniref:Uncharacterized protein n=1 Tax=Hyalomma asiaticum TaxID=266040 RepID=A0ACB7T055_HYAAI|nr:hypothetical protein HPB50_026587 [Hyalomma asiaticum]
MTTAQPGCAGGSNRGATLTLFDRGGACAVTNLPAARSRLVRERRALGTEWPTLSSVRAFVPALAASEALLAEVRTFLPLTADALGEGRMTRLPLLP